jgi:hypothetical protein
LPNQARNWRDVALDGVLEDGVVTVSEKGTGYTPLPRRRTSVLEPVPAGPGRRRRVGSIDILARLIGQWLSERLGQPFVIENRERACGR